QRVSGIEGAQLRRLVGPAEDRERPQGGAEPGVQHVLVLAQIAAARAAAFGRLLGDVGLLAGLAVPAREPVPPPELARDAPGAKLVHPVEIDPLPPLRDDANLARLDGLASRPRQRLHATQALQRYQRLDSLARAVRIGKRVHVGVLAPNQPPLA